MTTEATKDLEISNLGDIEGKTLLVRIPDDASGDDARRIKEELHQAAPKSSFLVVQQLEILRLDDVPDVKVEIRDWLLDDEEFMSQMRSML